MLLREPIAPPLPADLRVRRETYPKAVYMEITDRCNLRCPMCRAGEVVGDILPLATFREIADELFPHATFVDLRGWGESTIVSDFELYLDYADRFPLMKKLITNGMVRKPELWRRLGSSGTMVGVSIDASTQPLLWELRTGARLERIVENVTTMVTACRESGRDPRLFIYFCITVGGANVADVKNIVRLGLDLGIDCFHLEGLTTNADDPQNLVRNRDAVLAEMPILRELAQATGARIELGASLLPEDVIGPAVDKVCIHPFDYLYVNARGRLGFCDHLNGQEQFTFGKWSAGTFGEFWNGPEMVQLRTEHLNRHARTGHVDMCEECNWCYDRRYMDLEDLIDPAWDAYRVRL